MSSDDDDDDDDELIAIQTPHMSIGFIGQGGHQPHTLYVSDEPMGISLLSMQTDLHRSNHLGDFG